VSGDDFGIELGPSVRRHIEQKMSPLADPALAAVAYDAPSSDQTPVFVTEEVLRNIEKHAAKEKSREIGGILLGNFHRNESGSFVEITDFVEAAHTKGTDVSLTFTHETWAQLTAEHAARGSDKQIVGWYHSHPGLGVFMSREDEFVHSSFFADPWQTALVVDPIYHNWGCFKWADGNLQRTGGFYVFADRKSVKRVREYVKTMSESRQAGPRSASASADRPHPSARPSRVVWIVVACLLAAQIATGIVAFSRRGPSLDRTDHLATARLLLEVSDLSGAAIELRQHLLDYPTDYSALRLLAVVTDLQADPSVGGAFGQRLDAINFMLSRADEAARSDPKMEKPSAFGGIGVRQIGADSGEMTGKLEAIDPLSGALQVYREAATTREARLSRARRVVKLLASSSISSREWAKRAVDHVKVEALREMAYGVGSGDEAYARKLKLLSARDRDHVKQVIAGLKSEGR